MASKVYSKGVGLFGALGHGNLLSDVNKFRMIDFSQILKPKIVIKQLAAGWGHSAVLTSDGHALIFGRPYEFQNILYV